MAGPVDPRLLRRARATRNYLVAGVAVGIATAMLAIAQAWLLSRLVVGVFTAHRLERPLLLVWLAVVFVGRAGLGWANQVLAHRSSAAVKSQLRDDIVAARGRAPLAQRSSGETVQLMTTGLDALDGYFAQYLPQLVLAASVPFIVGAVIMWVDWVSAVVLVCTLPLIPAFMILIGLRTQERVDRRWKVANRLANHFADLIAGLPTLQVFGRAAAQEKGLTQIEDRNRQETMGTLRVSFLSSLALELIATLSVAVVAVGIGLRVVAGELDYTTALFVLVLAPEAYTPIRLVGARYHDSADGVAAADSAFALIDAAPGPSGSLPAPSLTTATVRLEGLTHTYLGADTPALPPLDLELAPGQIVALTGASGGGKSTALAALMGFLSPTGGRITVDGTDLAHLDPTSWRRQVAWVGQHPGMIDGTVADNVALGDPTANRRQVAAALARAGAVGIPLDQHVGEDGVGLSAGERRRVAIARALLRIDAGARLLVLDEPTAGLDAESEATVLRSVREAGAGALVVSHRRTVLEAADQVVTVGAL